MYAVVQAPAIIGWTGMEMPSAWRKYRYSDPLQRQLQPGGKARAGRPMFTACAPISSDRWIKVRIGSNIRVLLVKVERRIGPEVRRLLFCHVITGEKKATEWDF